MSTTACDSIIQGEFNEQARGRIVLPTKDRKKIVEIILYNWSSSTIIWCDYFEMRIDAVAYL